MSKRAVVYKIAAHCARWVFFLDLVPSQEIQGECGLDRGANRHCSLRAHATKKIILTISKCRKIRGAFAESKNHSRDIEMNQAIVEHGSRTINGPQIQP